MGYKSRLAMPETEIRDTTLEMVAEIWTVTRAVEEYSARHGLAFYLADSIWSEGVFNCAGLYLSTLKNQIMQLWPLLHSD